MTTRDGWLRVSRKQPCPICEKPDWCVIGKLGVNCMRVMSDKPLKNGGWFHKIGDDVPRFEPPPKNEKPLPLLNAATLAHGWRRNTSREQVESLAVSLGVLPLALDELSAAYAPEHTAWAFPMSDERAEIIGIRLRNDDGDKWAVKGSRAGVFFPRDALCRLSTERIFIVEGTTDTAAALSIGLFAIGRPSCRGQEEMLIAILRDLAPKECAVVFDNDERWNEKLRRFEKPGVDGAEKLCSMIPFRTARFIPPTKDLREFVNLGGDSALINSMLCGCLWTRKA